MRKLSFALSALYTLALVIPASGDLLEYTFEGTIQKISFNQTAEALTNDVNLSTGTLPPDLPKQINDYIKCQFLVDTDLPGYTVSSDGSTTNKESASGIEPFYYDGQLLLTTSWNSDFFYAEQTNGMLFDESLAAESESYSAFGMNTTLTMTFFDGYVEPATYVNLYSGNTNHNTSIVSESESIDNWQVGMTFRFEEFLQTDQPSKAADFSGTIAISSSNMVLTSIKTPVNVPEPSTGLLLMCGLLIVIAGGLYSRFTEKRC